MFNLSGQEVDNLSGPYRVKTSRNIRLQKVFQAEPLVNVCLRCQKKYPSLSEEVIKFVTRSVATYAC